MIDLVQLQMLPEEKPVGLEMMGCGTGSCTCATGDFGSNPFCTNGWTAPHAHYVDNGQ